MGTYIPCKNLPFFRPLDFNKLMIYGVKELAVLHMVCVIPCHTLLFVDNIIQSFWDEMKRIAVEEQFSKFVINSKKPEIIQYTFVCNWK